MLYFKNDYSEGAHPRVLEHLIETNMEKLDGYGEDKYCRLAKEKIREATCCPEAEVFFISGGTQTNQAVIATMLERHEGVISAVTGHVACHEAGAIEYTGHKVITIPHYMGKIKAEDVDKWVETFYADESHSHMVYPGMVYISHPTEYGTLYTKKELTEISEVCRKHKLPLFLDGARLGYALASGADLSLPDIASLCDVFYIGGTKCGALCGEAVVFTKNNAPKHFSTLVKQHGAMLAKGRVLGVQFDALFTDNLYVEISKNAIETAQMLKDAFREKGYEFFINSPTNQIFIILENGKMAKIKEKVCISYWEKYDENHTVVRFATSWATSCEDVQKLVELL
ncbi:MAG: aminotransferase class I/II-fold pyridoxal phosphate-dependent enzyme [Clostridia bacterium]|nr:aminotransferase class I/II-fold pyridoxal phosphate-dependent enzyme [Clostridia bacterium]